MDALDNLKKHWHNQDKDLPRLSQNDLYAMILKKSSSMVKWIFIISLGEFAFWLGFILIAPKSGVEYIEKSGLYPFTLASNILYYAIFIGFIYLFFKNHKRISATNSIGELMTNILRTRKTVRYFIAFNVTWMAVVLIVLNISYYNNLDILLEVIQNEQDPLIITSESFYFGFFIGQLIFGVLLIGGMLLFYRIIYGIFLRRLQRNYKELKKMY